METDEELKSAAQQVIGTGEQVVAAGIFGLRDNYTVIVAGGLAADVAISGLPNSAITSGVAGAAGTYAARVINAKSKGVTVRMLVAVTASKLHILALPSVGNRPERELMVFERAGMTSKVTKFGLSRRLTLADSAGQELPLTCSAAPWTSYASGAKAVLAALSDRL